MRTWMRSKVRLLFMTCAVLLAIPAIALADNINDDIADDTTTPLSLVKGDANSKPTAEVQVVGTGGDDDSGCNFDTATETVTISFNTPPGVTATALDGATATAGEMKFTTCLTKQTVQFQASNTATAGNYVVTANIVSNTSGGSFNNNVNIPITVSNPPDDVAPTVSSINRVSAENTNTTGNLSWNVTFNESVTGVDRTDFALVNTGLGGSPDILAQDAVPTAGVTGSGANYTVTASTGSGSGTLGLNLNDNDSIKDAANNLLGGQGTGTAAVTSEEPGDGSFAGQVYIIDRTLPTVTSTALKGPNFAATDTYTANTWTNQSVRVTFTCADTGGSGLTSASSLTEVDNFTTETSEATATFDGTCADQAGNTAAPASFGPIKIDKGAPNAPSANADRAPEYDGDGTNDWFLNTVTVTFTDNGDPDLADGNDGSGVDLSTLSDPVIKSTSGSHTVTDTVDDNAGNTSAQGSLTVQVDATRPTVDLTCPTGPVVQGSTTASASWTADDAHSGLATDASGSISLNTSAIGPQTATAAAGTAEDNVGLESLADTCSYNVIYNWSGFFSPVDNKDEDGHYILNSAKAGSSIPVKFSLSGNQGMDIITSAKSEKIACDSTAEVDGIETLATAGSSGLNYDSSTDQYNYIWKTDKTWSGTAAGPCRQLVVTLKDGTIHRANFKFLKP